MNTRRLAWFATAAVLAAHTGCSIDEKDRCPDGFFYVPEIQVCCLDGYVYEQGNPMLCIPEDTDTDTNESSDTSTETDGNLDGLGTPCSDDSGCAGLGADYCAVNPTSGTGYCTVLDCTSDICPDSYLCCDCTASTSVPQVVACLTDSDAILVGQVGCTCE